MVSHTLGKYVYLKEQWYATCLIVILKIGTLPGKWGQRLAGKVLSDLSQSRGLGGAGEDMRRKSLALRDRDAGEWESEVFLKASGY